MTRALEELIDSSRSVCEDPRKFIENKLFDTLKALKPASETWLFLKDALVLQGARAEHATVKLGKDKFEVVAIYNKRGDLIKEYSFVELPDDNGLVTLDDFEGLLKDGVFEFGFSESKPKTYFKNFLDEVKNARKQDVTKEFKQDLDNSLLSMYVPIAAATGRKNFAKVVDLMKEHEPELYDILKATCNIKFNSPKNIADTLYDNLTKQAKQILLAERKEHEKELAEIIDLPAYTRVANVAKNVVANGLIWTPILATIAGMAGLIATVPHAAAENSPQKTNSRDTTQPTQIALPGDQNGPIITWDNTIIFRDDDYTLQKYNMLTGEKQLFSSDALTEIQTKDSKLIVGEEEFGSGKTRVKIYDKYTGYTIQLEDAVDGFTVNGDNLTTVDELALENKSYIIKTYDLKTGLLVSSDVINTAKYCFPRIAGNHIIFTAASPATYTLDFFYCYDINNKTLKTVNLNRQSQILQSTYISDNYFTFVRADSYDINGKTYSTPYFYVYNINKNILKNTTIIPSIDYVTTIPSVPYDFDGNRLVYFYDSGLMYDASDSSTTKISPDNLGSWFLGKYRAIVAKNFDFFLYNPLTKKEEFITDNVCSAILAENNLILSKNVNGQPDNGGLYKYNLTTKKLEQLVAPNPNLDPYSLSSFNKGRLCMFTDVNKDPKNPNYDIFYLDLYPVQVSPWQIEKIKQYAPTIVYDSRPELPRGSTIYLPANPHADNLDVTDNHENYDADPHVKFRVDGKLPAYTKVTEYPSEGYDIYTYIYYRADNPHWNGMTAFAHEHDVQRVHVKVDRTTGKAVEIAYSQHNWMAKHEVKNDSDLTLYSEWGGHEFWRYPWSAADGKGWNLSLSYYTFRSLEELINSNDLDKDGRYKTDESHAPWSPPPKGPWLCKDVQDPKSAFEPFGGKAGAFTAELHSPGDLSVILDGSETSATKSEIPNSAWQNNVIGILGVDQNDAPTLKVVGTENETYGISGTLAADKPYIINFTAIPIKNGEVHTYRILNWKDYADGKPAVEWTIQKEGKTYSKTVSVSEVTAAKYAEIIKEAPNGNHTKPADNTPLIIGAGTGIGIGIGLGCYLMMRRRRQQPPMQTDRQQAFVPQQELSAPPQTRNDMYASDYEDRQQDYYADGYAEPQDTCAPAADQEPYYDKSYPQEYPKQPETPIQQQDSDIEDVIKRLQDLKRLDP